MNILTISARAAVRSPSPVGPGGGRRRGFPNGQPRGVLHRLRARRREPDDLPARHGQAAEGNPGCRLPVRSLLHVTSKHVLQPQNIEGGGVQGEAF